MKTDKLEKYLDELSDGTDFDFRISEIKNGEVELYMQGDNPCNEDWCTEITIKNPKRNGFQGVPGVVDLVHNEEYKENALKEFAEKLRDLL